MGERLVPRILGKDEMALLQGFAGAMARALGTPLTILMLTAERWSWSVAGPRGASDVAVPGGDGALLAGELLQLARLQRFLLEACDTESVVQHQIEVNESVLRALGLMAGVLEDRGLEPRVVLHPGPIRTTGDPLLLQRAFLDLVAPLTPGLARLEVQTRRAGSVVEILIRMLPAATLEVEEWADRFTLWREDGTAGPLWRACQFACRRHGQLELSAVDPSGVLVTLRWPEDTASMPHDPVAGAPRTPDC
jgi:hypothetical protein